MNKAKTLPLKFYKQKTETVAKRLLGKVLVRTFEDGTQLSGRIVETEAYLGEKDPACHTHRGRKTERVKSMWKEGGHAYIYLIYGMYNCFNVVTRTSKHPEAVLIRALEPLEGVKQQLQNRGLKNQRQLSNGPGKLCQALQIDRALDGCLLDSGELTIQDDGFKVARTEIIETFRVGVDYAGAAALWPLRFYLKNSDHVSKKIKTVLIAESQLQVVKKKKGTQ